MQKQAYNEALIKRFRHLPEIRRIERHRHIPQGLYKVRAVTAHLQGRWNRVPYGCVGAVGLQLDPVLMAVLYRLRGCGES